MLLPILSALIPAIVLLGYIYWRDRKSPEPIWQLVKATALGVASIGVSLCISQPLMAIGLIPEDIYSIGDAINVAFLGAAIPEELAKFVMLWLFLRNNRYFDERMDGIVYAVCISLGFAGLENVMYVVGDDDWMSVALSRAVFSVPGHFCDGVIMGYFYSLSRFTWTHLRWNKAMTIIAPIVAHGIFDAILFISGVQEYQWVSVILMLVFVIFCFYLWKWAARSIKSHVGE